MVTSSQRTSYGSSAQRPKKTPQSQVQMDGRYLLTLAVLKHSAPCAQKRGLSVPMTRSGLLVGQEPSQLQRLSIVMGNGRPSRVTCTLGPRRSKPSSTSATSFQKAYIQCVRPVLIVIRVVGRSVSRRLLLILKRSVLQTALTGAGRCGKDSRLALHLVLTRTATPARYASRGCRCCFPSDSGADTPRMRMQRQIY